MRSPAIPLDQLLPGGRAPDIHTQYRVVSLTGHYLPEGEALARLRTVQGEAAFEVLTPFRTNNGETVLVDRGYVRPVKGNMPPDYALAPGGDVTVTARVRQDEVDPNRRAPFFEGGHRQVYQVNSGTVGKAAGIDVRPGYFELLPDQPGVLGALPWPVLDPGPYLSYALQWLAFGTMALLGWGYYVWRELHPEKFGEKVNVAAAVAEMDRS
jgi:cytochrome oxidase assembly protein ShyY1